MIESALLEEGGLSREEIGKKLICFGADGVNVFQGHHNGCITQMRDFYAPFSLGVHCMAHRMNLVIGTLSLYPLVSNIEGLLASLHTYFSGRPKKCVELVKLAGIMETKGLKMLKCVKTRWVSMLSPCKRVLSEYRTLVVKMALDMNTCSAAKDNFDMLVDLEILLAFHCLCPCWRWSTRSSNGLKIEISMWCTSSKASSTTLPSCTGISWIQVQGFKLTFSKTTSSC
jgi:hypothetical protein